MSDLHFVLLIAGRCPFRAGGLFCFGKLFADGSAGLANVLISVLVFINQCVNTETVFHAGQVQGLIRQHGKQPVRVPAGCQLGEIGRYLHHKMIPPKKQIKHFSRMMMPVTKTDEKDAYMIAMYGEKMNPPIYKMPSQATIRILTTEGFTYFDNAKQLSRFIGICPTYQQSRTSVNIREHINRNDDERLRSLLYIAFWTALRYNSRECYIRLKANEKPFKVALIAVTNKLVRPVLTITTINSIYRWICPG